jgi:hypothetical protein
VSSVIKFALLPMVIKGKRWAAPPTLNHRFGHWSQRAKVVAAWRLAAWAEMRRHRIVAVPHIRISMTRYSVRDIDDDNLHSCFKPIVDGIVDAGQVPDDTRKHVTRVVTLIRVAHFAEERLEIEVEEMAGPPPPPPAPPLVL